MARPVFTGDKRNSREGEVQTLSNRLVPSSRFSNVSVVSRPCFAAVKPIDDLDAPAEARMIGVNRHRPVRLAPRAWESLENA